MAHDVGGQCQQAATEHLRAFIEQLRQATEQASLQLQAYQQREQSQTGW